MTIYKFFFNSKCNGKYIRNGKFKFYIWILSLFILQFMICLVDSRSTIIRRCISRWWIQMYKCSGVEKFYVSLGFWCSFIKCSINFLSDFVVFSIRVWGKLLFTNDCGILSISLAKLSQLEQFFQATWIVIWTDIEYGCIAYIYIICLFENDSCWRSETSIYE